MSDFIGGDFNHLQRFFVCVVGQQPLENLVGDCFTLGQMRAFVQEERDEATGMLSRLVESLWDHTKFNRVIRLLSLWVPVS